MKTKKSSLAEIFEVTDYSQNQDLNPRVEIIELLFKSQLEAHITHILQKDKTYATHNALEQYYEEIDSIADSFIETTMGRYEVTNITVSSCSCIENPIEYFNILYMKIENLRNKITEGYLLNQIDEVQQLIAQTLYRLKHILT